jgi:hypothetical protein
MVTAGAVAAAVLLIPLHAEAAKGPARANDFNGDGRRDVAVGVPEGAVPGKPGTGLVTVAYGGSKKRQAVRQIDLTFPASQEGLGGVGFGEDLASADFDRDGYADLAIGQEGAVNIVFGSAKGLTRKAVQLRLGNVAGAYRNVAVGDFDRNGRTELVATEGESYWIFDNVGRNAVAGKHVIPPRDPNYAYGDDGPPAAMQLYPVVGDFTGDKRADLILLRGINNEGEVYQSMLATKGSATGLTAPVNHAYKGGLEAVAGDVNGDGRADLIAGDANWSGTAYHAKVSVYLSRGSGFGKPKTFDPGTKGGRTVVSPEVSLTVGDLNRDGRADVVVGDKYEGPRAGGLVSVYYGTRKGLNTRASALISENTRGVPGTAKTGDAFGSEVSLTDLTGDGRPELVVGAPGETLVYVFRNINGKISTSSVRTLTPRSFGITSLTFGEYLL